MQTQLNVVSKDDQVQDLLNNNNDGIDTEDTENIEQHEDPAKNTEHSSIEKSDKKLWESSQMQNRKKMPRFQHFSTRYCSVIHTPYYNPTAYLLF